MTRFQSKALAGAMAALCLTVGSAAEAGGGLAVSPISVNFTADGGARAIEIANPGDEAIHVQVRLFGWTVDRDGDHYAASGDVAFSPPMFALEPGATQIVRLAPLKGGENRERAYRLFVDELAEQAKAGQLQMPVRMVLPVFVPPDAAGGDPPVARLQWRMEFDQRNRRAILIAANAGGRRARISELSYAKDGATHSIQKGLAGYVLAGQERGWSFPYEGKLGALDIIATSDVGPIQARVAFPSD